MRVTLLTRSLERGGAERQLSWLAQGLAQRGHQVNVLSFYPGGGLEGELRAGGVPIWSPGKSGRWDLLGFGQRLIALLRRLQPQVLYSFLDTPNLVAAWLSPFLPGTRIVWGIRASDMDLTRYGDFARLAHRSLRLSAWGADLIIANSRAGAAHHQAQGLPAHKMRVIPNGIAIDRFAPDRASGLPWRARWGVEHDRLLVGLVARLDPMKDVPCFLVAASHLLQARPGPRFVIVGHGAEPYASELRRRAEEMSLAPHLTWAGEQSDMPAIMNALDLCVLSSAFGEGFPNVVGEAMATAVPVVVTDVGDAAWVVGDPRLVAPKGDPQALAGAALRVLEMTAEERAALGRALRTRVEENFSLEAMVAASEQALAEILGGAG
jgi:glycosyltransferase involved in cell wall biosynthesis